MDLRPANFLGFVTEYVHIFFSLLISMYIWILDHMVFPLSAFTRISFSSLAKESQQTHFFFCCSFDPCGNVENWNDIAYYTEKCALVWIKAITFEMHCLHIEA